MNYYMWSLMWAAFPFIVIAFAKALHNGTRIKKLEEQVAILERQLNP